MATTSFAPQQWGYRTQKRVGLGAGAPSFASHSLPDLEATARTIVYSPDGSIFAASYDDSVRLVSTGAASAAEVVPTPSFILAAAKVIDMRFSPRGRYLSTWERPNKDADGNPIKNHSIWNTQSGERIASFERRNQEGCHFQFTNDEQHAIRQVATELQVFSTADMNGHVVGRLKLEGITSYEVGPGERPSVAVFLGEKKGAPASVQVYPLASLIPSPAAPPKPISQKTFFKADKIQIKWNTAGTAILFLTSTEHDKTGKSYYGETNLYMMSTRGDFDCRVGLDKEGPVHDFEWNPNCREFAVIYGYMPAKATLFSSQVKVIAELGVAGRNFAAFNPQGRLLLIAGFGNLNGTVDVWDRELLGGAAGSSAEASARAKLHSFDASNSSVCQWSPDGQFVLTATLSPRLRVENGIRIWHYTGKLVHVEMQDEMYQATWRPKLPSDCLADHPFSKAVRPAPTASQAATALLDAQAAKAAAKAASATEANGKHSGGAYRPPGARSGGASSEFARLYQESANASAPSSPAKNGAYVPPGAGARGKRSIPGAAPPPGSVPTGPAKSPGGKKAGKNGKASAPSTPNTAASFNASSEPSVPATSGATDIGGDAEGAAAIEKKVRNINKKLKAIQDLKDRKAKGETLEEMQLSKIAGEAELRKELKALQ
ncbi:translation initiation factor eIF-2A [Ceraceosorus guamensis]|uniref:Eukaryotic translation initiation factor 2A n=1 Tax=Ceraceosorus guamensis TaxID=1522189 RepID=A0A316VUT1_9BASI|nr:translation initiation factor eIF-2A [Ceraceosorus guamensis]PWN41014.1 translation initiation factor eIF-2A [Ceraceosorus guamensis]